MQSPNRDADASKQDAAAWASSPTDLHALIAVAAYFRAEQRGFSPGYELDDWLAAEADIRAKVSKVARRTHRSES
jgi:hypothetical protein